MQADRVSWVSGIVELKLWYPKKMATIKFIRKVTLEDPGVTNDDWGESLT